MPEAGSTANVSVWGWRLASKAIDKGDFDAVVKAMDEGGDDIAKAVDS